MEDEGVSGADLDDLLDEMTGPAKGSAIPVRRSPAQVKAAERRAEAKAEEDALRAAQDANKARAAQLAQIVNLHIAGYSLAEIGASIGASESEVDRMLSNDMARYVRSQPALRTYVRNYVSGKYTELLEAVWDEATDQTHPEKLENSAQALRILKEMSHLHGAAAPVQSEVKVESAPEAVERMVSALSAAKGIGYDTDVFDVEVIEDTGVESTDVHAAPAQALAALEQASKAVEEDNGDERL